MAASLDPRLARFRSVLQLFPDEQAQALGPMVQRIAALVGKLSATHLHGVDPNGFDGVEQRGEYHRLLTTEWLLAEEAPDEFLRRARGVLNSVLLSGPNWLVDGLARLHSDQMFARAGE